MRLQLPHQIVYLNGDHTNKMRQSETYYCTANRKHWYCGKEYENVPKMYIFSMLKYFYMINY